MWRFYESRLLEYLPAVATPITVHHSATTYIREDITTIRYFDGRVNSFHRATLDYFLLPYATDWDAVSWPASQAVLLWRSLCVHGAVMQVCRCASMIAC